MPGWFKVIGIASDPTGKSYDNVKRVVLAKIRLEKLFCNFHLVLESNPGTLDH